MGGGIDHALIESNYESGTDPRGFPGLLARFAAAFDARAADCSILDAGSSHANLGVTHGVPPHAQRRAETTACSAAGGGPPGCGGHGV